MNGNGEAARAWLQKSGSDLAAAELCLAAGKALDAACFHCQQAAEKSLKAWLVVHETAFPFVHDLGKLLTLCAQVNPDFERVRELALTLNPFAVEMRYDAEFWPAPSDAAEALKAAQEIHRWLSSTGPRRDRHESRAPKFSGS